MVWRISSCRKTMTIVTLHSAAWQQVTGTLIQWNNVYFGLPENDEEPAAKKWALPPFSILFHIGTIWIMQLNKSIYCSTCLLISQYYFTVAQFESCNLTSVLTVARVSAYLFIDLTFDHVLNPIDLSRCSRHTGPFASRHMSSDW